MKDKIFSVWQRLKALPMPPVHTSMKIIYWYGGGLAVMTALLIGAWVWLWVETGVPDMATLVTIFKEYTAPAVVAAFTFVSVFCVDKDGDGRPDAAANQSETKK